MKIRKTLIIFFIIICCFSVASITMAFKLKSTLNEVEKAQTNRHESLQLADELRQSSDDLTRFARTYVTTGDKKYKKYFNKYSISEMEFYQDPMTTKTFIGI